MNALGPIRLPIAESFLGQITWTESDTGYCRCPGLDLHTNPNGPRDCRVIVSGVPTIHCLHSSCAGAVEDANRRLRSAIGKAEYLKQAPRFESRGPTPAEIERRRQAKAKEELERRSKMSLPQIVAENSTDLAELWEASPTRLLGDPKNDWRLLLQLFPQDAVLWIGEPTDSCDDHVDEKRKEYCRGRFRTVTEWMKEPEAPGPFTCPNLFRRGGHSRSNDNVTARPFLVVESDTLNKEQSVSIFQWMRRFMRMRAVVDTAGKSLRGWFDFPCEAFLGQLRVMLPAFGCDEALFRAAQPCRLPGAKRGDKTQSFVWLDLESNT
jgi:hypothetical protein